jgi:glycosyltransferase involved in cell wall biosynthesis
LINLIWTFSPGGFRYYGPQLRKLKAKGITPILIGSAPRDIFFLRMFGIRCVLLNQNQFLLEENIAVRTVQSPFDYDAFYAAQAKPFKRMHLAQEIEKLYILTYGWSKELNSTRILSEFEPSVGHASYNKNYLGFEEVAEIMSQSACALALSRKEGAMWAAVEALLSGLPLVSTKSIGGRDRYFDPQTVKMVPADPAAVKAAVEEFKRNPPDPAEVRRITLEKMEADRKVTVEWFQDRILKEAGYSNANIYARLFRDGSARTPIDFKQDTL